MTVASSIWAQKYRPENFEDYIFHSAELEKESQKWLEQGSIPNLILYSKNPGSGKSSLAHVIINEFNLDDSDVLLMNGSTQNKMDDVRNNIEPFVRRMPFTSEFSLVVIEEAHRLTKNVQAALLEIVEKNSHVRFIMTTNFPQKLLPPLLSRFDVYDFGEVDEEKVILFGADVLEAEGVELTEEAESLLIDHLDATFPDIRSFLNSLQRSVNNGKLTDPVGVKVSGEDSDWEAVWSGEDVNIRDAISAASSINQDNYDFFYEVIYTNLSRMFGKEPDLMGELIPVLSEYVFKAQNSMGGAAIQQLHLEAFLYIMDMKISEFLSDH